MACEYEQKKTPHKSALENSSCCPSEAPSVDEGASCHSEKKSFDYLLWGSLTITALGYGGHLFFGETLMGIPGVHEISHTSFEMINTMWFGIVLGVLMVAIIGKIPRDFVMSALGTKGGINGILRVTFAGVLLDLCNHGILMVASKLYERGLSAGQVIAFLVASPWNSFSLTIILITLIGWQWTLLFILLSMVIALITGLMFEALTKKGVLPENPHQQDLAEGFEFFPEAKKQFSETQFNFIFFKEMLIQGVKDSRMVMRWVFFGIVLAGVIRALFTPEQFAQYFGPTLIGLLTTLVATTLIEVCSEGSTPIASDLLNRANAPGNAFTFLMAGAATDYTEIMVLKETTRSLKLALFLPLLTIPQVLAVSYIMNMY
jgi:uncharacterized membrane protein YraQ (UPF0718 family)